MATAMVTVAMSTGKAMATAVATATVLMATVKVYAGNGKRDGVCESGDVDGDGNGNGNGGRNGNGADGDGEGEVVVPTFVPIAVDQRHTEAFVFLKEAPEYFRAVRAGSGGSGFSEATSTAANMITDREEDVIHSKGFLHFRRFQVTFVRVVTVTGEQLVELVHEAKLGGIPL